MSHLKVVLIGLPGSGKSTFGRKLAKAAEVDFLDLDQLIELKEKRKIPEIFNQDGEETFRRIESKTLQEILDQEQSFVLASGGGCPCFNDNMSLIKEKSTSVYLDLPVESISSRLNNAQYQKRPMFEGMDKAQILAKVKQLKIEREPFYNLADIKLTGEDFSAEILIQELIRQIKS